LLALQNLAILSDEEYGAEKEGRSNMAYDVVIKDGRIYDGSGLPSFKGDVAVNGAQIVEVGRINGSARRVIHADGLAVAPGLSTSTRTWMPSFFGIPLPPHPVSMELPL
jgi:hypothetical protein